jgi:hypothetical protein
VTTLIAVAFRAWYISNAADPNGSKWNVIICADSLAELEQKLELRRPAGHWLYAVTGPNGELAWPQGREEGWDLDVVNAILFPGAS